MRKKFNYLEFNQSQLYFSNNKVYFEIHFKCEKCNFTKILDLKNAIVGNCYIHCNTCDIYYKLTYNIKKIEILEYYLKVISKKEVMENIMFAKNGYTIIEV